MKDITFNKNRYTVVKIGNKPRNYRTRNVDICVTCDVSLLIIKRNYQM